MSTKYAPVALPDDPAMSLRFVGAFNTLQREAFILYEQGLITQRQYEYIARECSDFAKEMQCMLDMYAKVGR